jgi:mono/diheme cytochrome c family protein
MNMAREQTGIFFPLMKAASIAALLLTVYVHWAHAEQGIGDLPKDGRGLYESACMACHGVDGAGAPLSRVGFDLPLPDFTDCTFAPREADTDWIGVAAEGGPARAFSNRMPAFGDALTDKQIGEILNHIRNFCDNPSYPRGDLNLPRALYTGKAFPEDEAVFTSTFNTQGNVKIVNKIIYERRVGSRSQWEIVVPFGWNELPVFEEEDNMDWESGLGDVALSAKHVLFASPESGSILSLGGEILFPTGDEDKGLGNGTTVFEPYVAFGQILPSDFFLQFQGGGGISFDRDKAEHEVFWRLAAGRQIYQGHFGRSWAPMIELLGSKELDSHANTHWDIVPQFQVSLSKRQHVRLNVGVRIPVNDTDVRETQYGVYLLWDWFDGGFFEGWR